MNADKKVLIIAEKPSVAADIAKALGHFEKHNDYYESDQYVLSFALGHLLELSVPDEFDAKKGKWTFAKLPLIPPYFDLKVVDKTKDRLKVLMQLIKRKDISCVVNACDAGREGELIFRYIIQFSKTTKPTARLWLRSMTQNSIQEGFKKLRKDEEMLALSDAARCRAEADWLIGINGTRCMTAFNSREGGFRLTTIGRVQTPTLAMVVEREKQIKAFKSQDYWELHALFAVGDETYPGIWFDATQKNNKSTADHEHRRPHRLWEKEKAEEIYRACMVTKEGLARDENKPSKQSPPPLFDLTSLQREANKRFGFSARTTLNIAQSLYEKHKIITYPRTDARALPEDYPATIKKILGTMADQPSLAAYAPFAKTILDKTWIDGKNKKIFDNQKISDHFAIIPTNAAPKKLSEVEWKIFDCVMRRFLGVFFPPAEFLVTTRITTLGEHQFRTEGKVVTSLGWRALYQNEKDDHALPAVKPHQKVLLDELKIKDLQTKPTPRFTEASLLSAMENAGKFVEDDEFREAMGKKGLGTPATRAAIIEGLIHEEYIIRQDKELLPTVKAFSLMTLLNGLTISELTSPELTGEWEHKLSLIEKNELSRKNFMDAIREMTAHIVSQAKNYESDTVPGDYVTLKTPCPQCRHLIRENYRSFKCQTCGFSLPKALAGRLFAQEEIEELIEKGAIGTITGFRSRQGRLFSAALKLNEEGQIEFNFGPDPNTADGDTFNFEEQEPLGNCPYCTGRIFEWPAHYVCENAVGTNKTCSFKTAKIILQRPIEKEQIIKLLAFGETDFLDQFISKKGRPFSAQLVIKKEDQSLGFVFKEKDSQSTSKQRKNTSVKKKEKPSTKTEKTKKTTTKTKKTTNKESPKTKKKTVKTKKST